MISKKEFNIKIEAIGELLNTGYYSIAISALNDIGISDKMASDMVLDWKEGNFPSKDEFGEMYDTVVKEMYKMQYKELTLDERPDIEITKDKMDDLKNMLEGDLDILDIINQIQYIYCKEKHNGNKYFYNGNGRDSKLKHNDYVVNV